VTENYERVAGQPFLNQVREGLPTNRTLSLRQGGLVMVKRWNTSAEHERRILLVSFFAQRLSQSYARRRYAW
jgi:hypothetical protein